MTKTNILDEIAEVRKTISFFNQVFLLLSCQSEPLEPEVLETVSRLLEDVGKKIQEIEGYIATLEFNENEIS